MFENLEVKDPKEASKRFKEALEKEKSRNAERLNKLEKEYGKREKDHEMALSRRDLRIDELKKDLEHASSSLEAGVTRSQYEREWKANKDNIAKWQQTFRDNEEKWKNALNRAVCAKSSLYICAISNSEVGSVRSEQQNLRTEISEV